jgi:hypothetical protein
MGINLTQTSELRALREAIVFLELVQMIEDLLQKNTVHRPPDIITGQTEVREVA